MAQAIVRDPEIMHGTPVFRGTRVPAQTLFDYIEGDETLEDFLEGFPTVSRDLALQALEEAKHLLLAQADRHEIYFLISVHPCLSVAMTCQDRNRCFGLTAVFGFCRSWWRPSSAA